MIALKGIVLAQIVASMIMPNNSPREVRTFIQEKPAVVQEEVEPPSTDLLKYAEFRIGKEFGESQWSSFYQLVDKESSWIVGNVNKSSGACGLGQAYPCSKMNGLGNTVEELNFTIQYVRTRYTTPDEAWKYWKKHKSY